VCRRCRTKHWWLAASMQKLHSFSHRLRDAEALLFWGISNMMQIYPLVNPSFYGKKTIEPMQVCRSGRDPWEEKLMTLLRRVVWRIRRNLVACRTFALCYIACTRRIRRRELFLDCGWSVAVVPISKHHSVGFLPCMYSICGYVGIYANISVHIYKWYINIYYILYIYI
jgi:hypothetical protein